MMTIANPIYDSVFKFLMEDERVAWTILSALLKKDILKVEVRPHEYSNSQRDTLSMFRIDFAATIREDDGSEHLILIEVQKTWLETETLRFRQYLGVQYQRKENIIAGSKEGYAMPMVALVQMCHGKALTFLSHSLISLVVRFMIVTMLLLWVQMQDIFSTLICRIHGLSRIKPTSLVCSLMMTIRTLHQTVS